MVYKRPTDFIPRKPKRSSEPTELCLEDLLNALPVESEKSSECNELDFLGSSCNEPPSAVGRWSSSSSLDFWSGEEDGLKSEPKTVRFKFVEAREYKRCGIADAHESALSLDWEHVESQTKDVDDYEATRDLSSRPKRLSPERREARIRQA